MGVFPSNWKAARFRGGSGFRPSRDRWKPCTTSAGHSYPVHRSAFILCKLAPRGLAVFQIDTKSQHLAKALEQNNDDGIRKKEFIKTKLKITPRFTLEIALCLEQASLNAVHCVGKFSLESGFPTQHYSNSPCSWNPQKNCSTTEKATSWQVSPWYACVSEQVSARPAELERENYWQRVAKAIRFTAPLKWCLIRDNQLPRDNF